MSLVVDLGQLAHRADMPLFRCFGEPVDSRPSLLPREKPELESRLRIAVVSHRSENGTGGAVIMRFRRLSFTEWRYNHRGHERRG